MIGDGKHKGSSSAGGEQSWRALAGTRKSKRLKSPQARRRKKAKVLKLCFAFVLFCLIVGGVSWTVVALSQRETPIEITAPSKPVEQIIFDTDGALPDAWLGSVIELRRETTLMEVDIHKMKGQLEAHGQVVSASVEREFPNALKIIVEERKPTLRMRVMSDDGEPVLRVVSRDGVLYEGVGYSRSTLHSLPYVVPFRHSDGRVLPMLGIEKVAELLDVTRASKADFFATWEWVDLRYFSGDLEVPGQVIEVRTRLVPRIIFGLNTDFSQQLDRLGVILDFVQSRGNPAIKRIDLSLLDSAAVQFESGRISTF